MRHLALLALMVPALAMAQPISGGNCGNPSSQCRALKFRLLQGNQLCLDSSTCSSTIKADGTTDGLVLTSGVANSGTNPAHILDTTNSMTGSTLLLSVRNQGSEVTKIDINGKVTASGGVLAGAAGVTTSGNPGFFYGTSSSGPADFAGSQSDGASAIGARIGSMNTLSNAAAKLVVVSNNMSGTPNDKAYFDLNGLLFTGSAFDPVPGVHHANAAAAQAIERARAAATANVLAVTFSTAFASAPICTCTDENASAVACAISTAANTTSVSFKGGGGATDTIDWICIGDR